MMSSLSSIRDTRAGRLLCLAGACIATIAIASCAGDDKQAATPPPPVPRALQVPRAWNSGTRPITQALSISDPAAPSAAGTQLVSTHALTASVPLDNRSSARGGFDKQPGVLLHVRYAANSANASEVVRTLIDEFLKRPYIMDPKLAGTITLDINEEMTPGDIEDFLGGLITMLGWTIEDVRGTLHIRPGNTPPGVMARSPSAPILSAPPAFESEAPVVRVRRLRYITPDSIKTVMEPLMSEGGKFLSVGRMVILADTGRQQARMSRLLAALDVPAFDGVSIWTYRLANTTPENAVKLLTPIIDGTKMGAGGAGAEPLVALVGIPNSANLMVISRDETVQSHVQSFILQVDQPRELPQRFRYIYRVQYYADLPKLTQLLRDFFSERIDNVGPVAAGAAPPAPTGGARIFLDVEEKMLLIHSTPEDYADLLSILRAVDRPRQQVHLSGVIAEVGLTGSLQFGVEYFLQAFDIDGLGVLELVGTPGLPAVSSGSAFFVGGDGIAIVQALESEGDVEILSQPRLTVRDREIGRIQVGGRTPVVSGDVNSDSVSDGTTAIRRSITYENTGIELKVTPRINETGDVTLAIELTINEVGQQTDLGPEFTTRALETSVIVPHGKTLVLGGIISSIKRNNVTRIPILGHIPLLGYAFQSTNDRDVKTELLLTITPSIINSPDDGMAVMSDFMAASRSVRAALEGIADRLPIGSLIQTPPMVEPVLEPVLSDIEPAPESGETDLPPDLPPDLRRRLESGSPR